MTLRDQLIRLEQWCHQAYPDPLTKGAPWTIGVGHTGPEVCAGLMWTDARIGAQLDQDIATATAEVLKALPWVATLNEPRQAVVIGMCFQMGLGRLLGFAKALAAMRDERWYVAESEMLDSDWARQTSTRAHLLATQMATGEWQ